MSVIMPSFVDEQIRLRKGQRIDEYYFFNWKRV